MVMHFLRYQLLLGIISRLLKILVFCLKFTINIALIDNLYLLTKLQLKSNKEQFNFFWSAKDKYNVTYLKMFQDGDIIFCISIEGIRTGLSGYLCRKTTKLGSLLLDKTDNLLLIFHGEMSMSSTQKEDISESNLLHLLDPDVFVCSVVRNAKFRFLNYFY